MSITTRSKFYYGHNVTDANFQLNFDEGAGELTASLITGSYSLETFAEAIQNRLNDTGTLDYTASVDRTTRKITISVASGTFTLLISSGSNVGTTAYTLAGFTGADVGPTASAEGDSASGSEYTPQFLLQKFINFDDFEQAADASVNKAASGNVEVISFGQERFSEFDIQWITDIPQGSGNIIETDASGVANARAFLRDITAKRFFEFMPDRDDPDTFTQVILDKIKGFKDGTGYRLNEEYGKGLPNYYSTGLITLREIT